MSDGALVEYNISGRGCYELEGDLANAPLWAWDMANAVFQYNEVYDTIQTRDGMGFDIDGQDYWGNTVPSGTGTDRGAHEYQAGPQAPAADFSGSPRSGPPPLTVNFTDLSASDPTSWDWTFGDGGTSQAQHPTHEYAAENTYTVNLTAANAYGQDTETKPDYITVTTGGGDRLCTSMTIEVGTLVSGDHTDTHASECLWSKVGPRVRGAPSLSCPGSRKREPRADAHRGLTRCHPGPQTRAGAPRPRRSYLRLHTSVCHMRTTQAKKRHLLGLCAHGRRKRYWLR